MPKIYGYTEILGDILITGSFSILGSASTINTTNLVVSDPIILLASGQTGSPVLDSGFFINRGTGATQAFIWDESADEFAMIQTSDNHESIGNVNISSYANLRLGNIGIGGAPSATSRAYIQGIDTGSNFALKVENSSSTNLISLRNDELINIGSAGGSSRVRVNLGDAQSFDINANDYSILTLSDGGTPWFTISPTAFNEAQLYSTGVLDIRAGGGNTLYARFNESAKGIGINIQTPTARLHVVGYDNTSSNFALKLESASASSLLQVVNNGSFQVGKAYNSGYNNTNFVDIISPSAYSTQQRLSVGFDSRIFANIDAGSTVAGGSLHVGSGGLYQYYTPAYYGRVEVNNYDTTKNLGWIWDNPTASVHLLSIIKTDSSERIFTIEQSSGNFGIGTGQLVAPTAKLHVKGIDNTSSNYSFKVESASASSLFNVRNDGYISGGTTSLYPNNLAYNFGGAGAYFDCDTFSVGSTTRGENTQLIINGGAYPTLVFNNAYYGNDMYLLSGAPGDHLEVSNSGTPGIFTYLSPRYLGIGFNGSYYTPQSSFEVIGLTSTSGGYNTKLYNSNYDVLFSVRNDGYVGIGLATASATLHVKGATSGATGSTIFKVDGNAGELFKITDTFDGSLFSVNNVSGFPILEVFSDDTLLMGDYNSPALFTTKKVTVNSGTTDIYSIATASYSRSYYDYTISDGTASRAGIITAVWLGPTIEYNETSTLNIGTTSNFTFSVVSDGTYSILRASASTSGWVVKTIIRSI